MTRTVAYEPLSLYIDGAFVEAGQRTTESVLNPASDAVLGHLPHASVADLDAALDGAQRAFASWRFESPLKRATILRKAAALIRERALAIAAQITLDQGKPLAEAVREVEGSAEVAEWHAEEGRRIYGRVVPSRDPAVRQLVLREAIGVCVAFTPWNFPFNQAIKKVCAALAAGCTMVLKGPETSPSAVVALARLFHDAGLPAGCLNVVWGVPQEVSNHLIGSPIVRKVSFTGSVPVGKQIAALASLHMKRTTMELGGHSPVIVCADADIEGAADMLVASKFRNAGQVCISPTRFYVQRSAYSRFVDRFIERTGRVIVGDGFDASHAMGPLAHGRRVAAMTDFVDDAKRGGAEVAVGGHRIGERGNYYAPTVVLEPATSSRLMNDEPFGPIAAIVAFDELDEAIAHANRLPFGLAAYAFTDSSHAAHRIVTHVEAGMVSINHFGLGPAEVPFGGIKDSGSGSEGGTETFDGYLVTKLVTQFNGVPHP